jgi:hypothetical protein
MKMPLHALGANCGQAMVQKLSTVISQPLHVALSYLIAVGHSYFQKKGIKTGGENK